MNIKKQKPINHIPSRKIKVFNPDLFYKPKFNFLKEIKPIEDNPIKLVPIKKKSENKINNKSDLLKDIKTKIINKPKTKQEPNLVKEIKPVNESLTPLTISDVKLQVETEVNNILYQKFRMINPSTFQKIFTDKTIYKYYRQFNFNMSVYDLLKTANNNKNLRKIEVDKYKNYFTDTVFTRNSRLIGHLYKINKSKISFDKLLLKKKFNKFLTSNNLYQTFNLKRDLPYPNYLQLKSEIQRSTVFRDLVNKESAYYRAVKRRPLVILVSPKPKNIYVTIYILSTNGYKILWKKSTGMLEKVEGQLSLAALIEIFNKINIFLTKNYLKLKHPLKLIIKSSKYYGTTNIIQNFVKIFQNNLKLNYIYFMYKYRKRFNFFSNYADLINDSLFNYLSAIWIKFLKIIKRTRLPREHIFSRKILDSYNNFFGLDFDHVKRRYKINHFTRVRRIKFLRNKKFIKI